MSQKTICPIYESSFVDQFPDCVRHIFPLILRDAKSDINLIEAGL